MAEQYQVSSDRGAPPGYARWALNSIRQLRDNAKKWPGQTAKPRDDGVHVPGLGTPWEGAARMAAARRDAGLELNAVDREALERHPIEPRPPRTTRWVGRGLAMELGVRAYGQQMGEQPGDWPRSLTEHERMLDDFEENADG